MKVASLMADLGWRRTGRTWLGALGSITIAGTLGVIAGPLGLLAGGGVIGLWYMVPSVYAVAFGHVLLLALPLSLEVFSLAFLEAGFVAVIAAPAVWSTDSLRPVLVTAVVTSILGGFVWTNWTMFDPRWLAAIAVIGPVVLTAYLLHRYQTVVLHHGGFQ